MSLFLSSSRRCCLLPVKILLPRHVPPFGGLLDGVAQARISWRKLFLSSSDTFPAKRPKGLCASPEQQGH
jgi:hypothetical protein